MSRPLTITGRYTVIAGVPSIVGGMKETRTGMELLLDETPDFDDWPLEEGDEIVVTRRAKPPIDAGEA